MLTRPFWVLDINHISRIVIELLERQISTKYNNDGFWYQPHFKNNYWIIKNKTQRHPLMKENFEPISPSDIWKKLETH